MEHEELQNHEAFRQEWSKAALEMTYDLSTMPFSRYGSYFVIDRMGHSGKERLFIRDIRGGDLDPGCQYAMTFLVDGTPVEEEELSFTQSPVQLVIALKNDANKSISFCMPTAGSIVVKGNGMDLSLTYQHKKYDSVYPLEDGSWELTSYSKEIKYRLRGRAGNMEIDAPWERIGSAHITILVNGPFEWSMTGYKVTESPSIIPPSQYAEGLRMVEEDYVGWHSNAARHLSDSIKQIMQMPGRRDRVMGALHILWMNVVAPEGLLKRPAMYMTKHYMTNIWSWDNCFGAIALAKVAPELAWHQLMMFSDMQHVSGAYPDYANDQYASYSSVKPPIYFWAYEQMRKENPVFEERRFVEEFYRTTASNTRFWLETRKTAYGLPAYRHGNESGWDNGTFYDGGVPVVSPDLAAFLIHQMDGLSMLAMGLGHSEASNEWATQADVMTEGLLRELWSEEGGRFTAIHVPSGKHVDVGDTLQAFIPLLISKRLPEEVVSRMLASVKDKSRFNCPWGLATEAVNSSYHTYDGYWRGPIWAPSTMIMADAIGRAGEAVYASEIMTKWVSLVEKSGFFENFDPISGEGLVDPSFAWTASVYLVLSIRSMA